MHRLADHRFDGESALPHPAPAPKAARLLDARAALSALIYLTCSLLFFGRKFALGVTPEKIKIGIGADPTLFVWFIKWWPHAIAHRLNPFHSAIVWAPIGVNLTWSSAIPLPALAAAPITAAFGPVASYNLLMLAAPVLAGFSAFLLCRRIAGAYWPSVLGGFIFAFSPYMLQQMLGHLHLVMVFGIPLAVLLTIDRIQGRLSASAYAISLGIVLAAEFFCAPELFATMTIFGAIALALALPLYGRAMRPWRVIAGLVIAYLIAIAIISPYLYAMFAYGSPEAALWPIERYSADLVNLIVPTTTNLLGSIGALKRISEKFAVISEDGACLTLPLIVIAEAYRRQAWRTATGKLLILMVVVTVVAAFGPLLHILGRPIIAMPWALAAMLPLVEHALPVRFAMYTFLALSIIATLWFARDSASHTVKWIAAALIVLFMLPNPYSAFWASPLDEPAFFSSGSYLSQIAPREIILALPYGQRGASMLWQADADFSFRLAGGWTTTLPFEFERAPIVNFFFGSISLPEAGEQLKAFIATHNVGAIVEDKNDPNRSIWEPVLSALKIAPIASGGVRIYPIAKDQFAPYAKFRGEELEQRAVALRMDTVLQACAVFLAQGNPVRDLSEYALAKARLLPSSWIVREKPDSFSQWSVLPTADGGVGIAISGSYAALLPMGERFHGRATKIEYPYPSEWSPGSSYPARVANRLMLFEFTPAALQAAAAQLKSGPLPERSAGFWPDAK